MHRVLSITGQAIDTIRRTLEKRPSGFEVCGFLLGSDGQDLINLSHAMVVRNSVTRPGGFSISRSEHARALRRAERSGMKLLAVFHTHPKGQCCLGAVDRRGLASSPVPWVILAPIIDEGRVRLLAEAFEPETGEPIKVKVGK